MRESVTLQNASFPLGSKNECGVQSPASGRDGDEVNTFIAADRLRWGMHHWSVPAFVNAVPGHLAGDEISQARVPIILKALNSIRDLSRTLPPKKR
jgi:hypothetical protein